MRILICTHNYWPKLGGIETVTLLMAEEFQKAGHSVQIVTATPEGSERREFPWPVHRNPSARRLWRLVRWADVVLHNQISLHTAWPVLIQRKPWVVAHHTWIERKGWKNRIKRLVFPCARNVAVSPAIAQDLPCPARVIPNPYQNTIFTKPEGVHRERDLVFLGRLVSDKGCNVFVEALAILRNEGLAPTATVIGDGPERGALEAQVKKHGLGDKLVFTGALSAMDLPAELARHQILVVPSLWAEPFGVVALEGMGCGCVPIVSADGGLPFAIGDCGLVFPNGDAQALAACMARLIKKPDLCETLRARAPAHLAEHEPKQIAAHYLAELRGALE